MNLMLGKSNILKDAEDMRKMVELQNFNLIVASRPKEHVHIKYEPNRPGSFNFEYAAGRN